MVRASDLKFVGRGFKSRSDRYLMLLSVPPMGSGQLSIQATYICLDMLPKVLKMSEKIKF